MRPQSGSRTKLRSFARRQTRLVSTWLSVALPSLSLGAFLLLGVSGCEDQAIGRPCQTLVEASNSQAVFNDQALECPTRLCIKPAYQSGAAPEAMTSAFCSTECSKDSDCDDGERRDKGNPNDKRCTGGFSCSVPFEVGPLACQKMCVCRDFLPKDSKAATAIPASCSGK